MTYDLRRVCEHGVITRTPAHPPLPGHRHLARDRLGRFPCHEFNRITSSSPAAGTARSPNRRTAAGGSYIRPAAAVRQYRALPVTGPPERHVGEGQRVRRQPRHGVAAPYHGDTPYSDNSVTPVPFTPYTTSVNVKAKHREKSQSL